ncbi:MAG TPA: hypothetical protein VLJ39_06575 [Tepidisphaeraceae bacterium]|nr:hypothetical protein [Tepidisphaeraceae bacterium]
MRLTPLLLLVLALGASVSLRVEIPTGMKVVAASAAAPSLKLSAEGKTAPGVITFDNLLPDTAYDLSLRLSDGTVLQGVDLGWYNEEPAKPGTEPVTDEDKKEIATIVNGLEPFMNHSEILELNASHDRAVALCQFVRDKGFVNDKGREIMWRAELWYFKYQAGGWEAVSQVNKVLRRKRFKSRAALTEATGKLKWVPRLGGIRTNGGSSPHVIRLSGSDLNSP